MKKKILFCCHGFEIGGIEKCMITLLNAIDTTRYEIDVLAMNPFNAMLPMLKADVNVLDTFDYVMNRDDTIAAFRAKGAGLGDYWRYLKFRVVNKFGKKPWRYFRVPDKLYDVAIAYAPIEFVPYYVIDRVQAKKKYIWHHAGRVVKDSREYFLDQEYYPKADGVIAVSNADRELLMEAYPHCLDKFQVLYNLVDKEEVRARAAEAVTDYTKKAGILKLTTVGRLTAQKGPDHLIEAAKLLKADHIPFCWYWVGDGDLTEWMEEEIRKNDLEEEVKLLGRKINPYPYMKNCDIYVQPSYYEAYCTTTLEAQTLEKPIVVTDVCGMREQFRETDLDGLLVKAEPRAIYAAIKELYENPERRKELSENLRRKMDSSEEILKSYYDLFEK